jgi:conjugal transfer pilus assembly protein TraV
VIPAHGGAPRRAKRLGALAIAGLLTMTSVAGCSMFHSNIKGGFACNAPDGSCAPTTIIDDVALRSIKQAEKPDGAPAGDLTLPSAATAAMQAEAANVILTTDRRGRPDRFVPPIGRRALRVAYPAHLDDAGRMVPKTIAYALVDLPEWAERQTGPVLTADGKVTSGVSRGLLGAAEHAPDALALRAASPRLPASEDQSLPTSPSAPVGTKEAAAPTPIDKIKAEAAQILAAGKVKSAGTFSPSGN